MSLCFLHAQESSFLVTRHESSHLLELPQLQTGGWLLVLCCLPVCPTAVPAHPRSCGNGGGEHTAVPILQISYETKKLKDLCKPSKSQGSKAMGWIWSTEEIPSDFLGMGLDPGNEKYQ